MIVKVNASDFMILHLSAAVGLLEISFFVIFCQFLCIWVCDRWWINIKALCCFLLWGYAFVWLFDFPLFWDILVIFCFNFWGWRFLWWCFWLFCSIYFRICSGSLWVYRFRFSFASVVRAGRWVTRREGWQIIGRSFAFEMEII